MLELADLTLSREAFTLRASFSVAAGRRVAVIGPSGAGKSTLLSVIAGFDAADTGSVLWGGTDLGALPPGKRPISMIFQDNNLFGHMTVGQNVGLGLSPALKLDAAGQARVEATLDRVGLAGTAQRRPADLSGGQRSRVALARTLVRERPLVLLDEPFAALGPALKADMLDLVAEATAERGMTVLMVTHDPGDARRFAGDTIFIDSGQAQPPVPTARLFDDPPPALKAYLGA